MLRIHNPNRAIALSEGKSLGDTTIKLFEDASMHIKRSHPRDDLARLEGCPGFDIIVFARADQVPWLVERGYVAAGITGLDRVIENTADIEECARLMYSRVSNGGISCVVFAGPGSAVQTLTHLRKYSQGPNGPVKVATEYPREVETFLGENGVNATVMPCSGKAELLVRIGVAEFGATITETGTSLEKNDCSILMMGDSPVTVFESSTVLIANRRWYGDSEKRMYIDALGRSLVGVLNARGKILLKMNAPLSNAERIMEYLKTNRAALGAPTISRHDNASETCSIESVVSATELNSLRMHLSALGASGFIDFVPKTVI